LRDLALNFASTHQVGNSAGISKVGENQQLLIAIVVLSDLISKSSIQKVNFPNAKFILSLPSVTAFLTSCWVPVR
jgi:hypothetical protein